jgi:hypothetical protein
MGHKTTSDIEFYNEVRKRWRDIAFATNCGIWSNLEGAWAEYAEENNFGNMYSQKKTRQDISSDTLDYEEAQEEELPADCFCVQDEINNCPWTENKTGEDDEDGSDYDDECSRPRKRAKDGNQHLPWVSTDSDTTALTQHESEEEFGRSSDGEGDRLVRHLRAHIQDTSNFGRTYKTHVIKNAPTRDMQLE